jgi:hypothetical protein
VLIEAAKILAPVVLLLAFGRVLGSGVLSRSGKPPDLTAAAWVALYVFAPCQVFSGLIGASFRASEVLQLFLAISVSLLALAGLALLVTRSLGREPSFRHPFLLSVLFANTGYYGLPVCYLAFGKDGFAVAALYMVCASVHTNTVGVYLAARGGASRQQALTTTLCSPIVWSLLLSFVVKGAGIDRPAWAFQAIDWIAYGAIPLALMLLGAQLAQFELARELKPIACSAALRLVAAPAIGAGVAALFGFPELIRQVFVVESAMPTGVIVGLFALTFDSEPQFVSGAVLLSTLVSPLTLLVVLALVR